MEVSYHSLTIYIICIARAYFLDGAYDQAEAALDELIPSIDSVPGDQVSPCLLAFFRSIEQL
jgi:hypothetical protein